MKSTHGFRIFKPETTSSHFFLRLKSIYRKVTKNTWLTQITLKERRSFHRKFVLLFFLLFFCFCFCFFHAHTSLLSPSHCTFFPFSSFLHLIFSHFQAVSFFRVSTSARRHMEYLPSLNKMQTWRINFDEERRLAKSCSLNTTEEESERWAASENI